MTALGFQPDVIVTAELEGYLRGRELGEVPTPIEQVANSCVLRQDQILRADLPPQAADIILDRVEPGDLALMLVLSERDEVLKLLGN